MNKKIKSLITTVSLLSIMTIQAEALHKVPPNVELLGNAEGIVYVPGDEPFLLGEDMSPGDKVTRTLEIKNKYDKAYELYLQAERVTPPEKYDLLDIINLKISYKDEVIYDGPVSGEDGLTENIELGLFEPGDEENLTAVAELDPSATNPAYLNKTVQVNWIFTAQAKESSKPTEPEVNNPSQNKPSNSTPQTGDQGIYAYLALGGASLLGLYNIRRKKD